MAQLITMRRCSPSPALAFFAALLPLQGCHPPAMHVRAKSLSPDHQKLAIVLEEDPLPLVSTTTVVAIKPINREIDEKADTVFQGGDMNGRRFGSVNVGWLKNGSLWIGYCSGRTSIFHNYWSDVHADNPAEVEVVLDKEAPGRWPQSGPPNGQSGPPPCT
jgi:hypothetical protein